MSAVVKVPPHWDPAVQPTKAEWVDWFLANDREDQETIAARAIGAFADINRCLSAPGATCWIDR